ncbi:S8 family serine peptidase [bacterium]|nr:S8 family serine peptidase [bacterium]
MTRFLTVIAIFALLSAGFAFPPPDEYQPGKALIKFSEDFGQPEVKLTDGVVSIGIAEFDELSQNYRFLELNKVFPHRSKPNSPVLINLSNIYRLHFPPEVSVREIVDALTNLKEIEYIEPDPVRKYDYTPNDPLLNYCWHIFNIRADSAWDLSHGDSTIVIGIVDSGIDIDHPDLVDNMWQNLGEDCNGDGIIDWYDWDGLDTDGNGYPDDFWGWDFIDGDNWVNDDDPGGTVGHGTHCAGDASAVTDNATGVSGTGFNCSLMTLRCGYGGYIQAGYQGIEYAGDNSAHVISLSWGGTWSSQTEQNVITDAWQAGSVICASAGNTTPPSMVPPYDHYPSKYNHVIAVVATTPSNTKAGFSNYSITAGDGNADVCAPGTDIWSTTYGGGYGGQWWSGTSMSSPIAAGVVAMIRSVAPDLTPAEVETVLCVSCDNIDMYNPSYAGRLGYGRVNMLNALLMISAPSIAMTDFAIIDNGNGDGRADPGETVELEVTIQNSINAQIGENIYGTISCDDPAVTITNGTFFFGDMLPGAVNSNASNPYVFDVGTCEPHWTDFTLTITGDGGYESEIIIEIELGRPPLLIVADDEGAGYQSFYLQSLQTLDIFSDVWVQAEAALTQDEILRYDTVIWETGNATVNTLSPTEQTILESYLDTGRNLILTGQNIAQELGASSFMVDYLHCQFDVSGITEFLTYGTVGDPVGNGDTLFTIGAAGAAGNATSRDALILSTGAVTTFRYPASGKIAAIRYEGGYKLCFFAFPLEAVATTPVAASRADVLQNIFNWFDSGSSATQEFELNANWNLISLGVTPADNSLAALFPTATAAYEYTGGPSGTYQLVNALDPGVGYWLYVPSAVARTITGAPFNSYSSTVSPPWELKGSVLDTAYASTTPAGGIVVMYWFNGSTYMMASAEDQLQPEYGYWMNLNSNVTQITVAPPAGMGKGNSNRLVDDLDQIWEMPVTVTGETGSAPNIFTVNIGGDNTSSYIPAPPPPPQYMVWTDLYDENWNGPYYNMYIANAVTDFTWILHIDPNGNVVPPISRTAVVDWNPASLPAEGDFSIEDLNGNVIVADMRTVSTFSTSGASEVYFYIIGENISAAPPVTVILNPQNPPITIPANGGAFEFEIGVSNNSSTVAVVDIWTFIYLPSGAQYGPVINAGPFNVQTGASPYRLRSQAVPANAPAGLYTYNAYIGDYPDSIIHTSFFEFEKLAVSDGGELVSDWKSWGESFEGFGEETAASNVTGYSMLRAHPNPFNPATVISFELRDAGQVKLAVYDVQGRQVVLLADGLLSAGLHEVNFNGEGLASGLYFARLQGDGINLTKKMLLMK